MSDHLNVNPFYLWFCPLEATALWHNAQNSEPEDLVEMLLLPF